MLYIVYCVIIEGDKVLLIRESKAPYHGKFYLPAGKADRHESLTAAFERELKEETHLEGLPDHLLSVNNVKTWYRISFIGHVTGGKLKTAEYEDRESIDAAWHNISDLINRKLDLREDDIIDVVQNAVQWLAADRKLCHEKNLPINVSHKHHLQRLFVIYKSNKKHMVLMSQDGSYPLKSISQKIPQYLQDAGLQIFGVISLEHNPEKHDGFCLNLLCEVKHKINTNGFIWIELSEDDEKMISSVKASSSFILT